MSGPSVSATSTPGPNVSSNPSSGMLLLMGNPLPNGDQEVISQDTSPFREGSWSLYPYGQINSMVGDYVMKYWSHNVGIDVNGNFLGKDDTGPSAFITFSEGIGVNAPKYQMWSNALGATGSAQGAFTLQYTLDLTTGDIQRPYTDSSATPGAATINTPRGRAAFAAAASTVVITSSIVSATSQIVVSMEGSDATLTSILRAVPGAGSFTVTGNATATAATPFKFSVLN